MVSSTWFSAESNLEGKGTKEQEQREAVRIGTPLDQGCDSSPVEKGIAVLFCLLTC